MIGGDKYFGQARADLVSIVRELARRQDVQQRLAEGKSRASEFERPDFVWYELLLSFSTMGNSRGKHGLIDNPENFSRVQFKALELLGSTEARIKQLRAVLQAAKVRMPAKKAEWLSAAFDRIASMGGPLAAKEQLQKSDARKGMIQFWREFDGIGEKYSRNIMMDVYHPEFRDSIAIDARIKRISKAHGLSFKSYEDAEQFFLGIAKEVGIEGWELDRMMYRFGNEFSKPMTAN